jgi:hypothetical protein
MITVAIHSIQGFDRSVDAAAASSAVFQRCLCRCALRSERVTTVGAVLCVRSAATVMHGQDQGRGLGLQMLRDVDSAERRSKQIQTLLTATKGSGPSHRRQGGVSARWYCEGTSATSMLWFSADQSERTDSTHNTPAYEARYSVAAAMSFSSPGLPEGRP